MAQHGQPLPPPDYAALNHANQALTAVLNTYTIQLPRVQAHLQPAVELQQVQVPQLAALGQQMLQVQQGQQAMQGHLATMQQAMQDQFAAMQQNMNLRFNTMEYKINITDIRAHNRTLNNMQPLEPLPNQAGLIPPNFPVNHTAIGSLTRPRLDDLLGFYGIPVQGAVDDKKRVLASHIGREW